MAASGHQQQSILKYATATSMSNSIPLRPPVPSKRRSAVVHKKHRLERLRKIARLAGSDSDWMQLWHTAMEA